MWQVWDGKTGRNSVAACHPIRVVFRGNCPCVREGPCRTPVAPRRRLTSGGGMRRASGTGLRVSQVSFAPEKRRTCTRPLSGGRTPPAYPGERRCRGRIRRVFTRRRLGGIPPAPPARKSACLRPRHSCLPGTPRVLPPESAPRPRPTVGAPVGRTLADRTIPTNNGDVTARDVPANRTTPALCAKPSTRRGTRRQGWTRETCAGASGFACRGRRRYSAKPSCA